MSNNKNDIDRYSRIFKALSNPNRLQIFLSLVSCCLPGTVLSFEDQGTAYVGDLAKNLDIVPSTVSHHVKELRQAGLVKVRRSGQKIKCWIDPKVIRELEEFFKDKG